MLCYAIPLYGALNMPKLQVSELWVLTSVSAKTHREQLPTTDGDGRRWLRPLGSCGSFPPHNGKDYTVFNHSFLVEGLSLNHFLLPSPTRGPTILGDFLCSRQHKVTVMALFPCTILVWLDSLLEAVVGIHNPFSVAGCHSGATKLLGHHL